MRISDWSSDVCSSDLEREAERDRSHPAYLAERWIRESGIHAHLADEGGCQAQATFQDLRLPVDVERLCRRAAATRPGSSPPIIRARGKRSFQEFGLIGFITLTPGGSRCVEIGSAHV